MEPIRHERRLACPADKAFDVYTGRIGQWWPPQYTMNPETLQTVTIEPHVGGRVFATHSVEGPHVWGKVILWEPERVVYTSTLSQPAEYPSEIAVRFRPDGDGCVLHFEHGGWNEHNAGYREKFGDWPLILDRFAKLANAA